jgi:predicted NUDIX family phosphoesterase
LIHGIPETLKEDINETDKMTADWIDKPGLAEFYKGMETCTKTTFDFYIK